MPSRSRPRDTLANTLEAGRFESGDATLPCAAAVGNGGRSTRRSAAPASCRCAATSLPSRARKASRHGWRVERGELIVERVHRLQKVDQRVERFLIAREERQPRPMTFSEVTPRLLDIRFPDRCACLRSAPSVRSFAVAGSICARSSWPAASCASVSMHCSLPSLTVRRFAEADAASVGKAICWMISQQHAEHHADQPLFEQGNVFAGVEDEGDRHRDAGHLEQRRSEADDAEDHHRQQQRAEPQVRRGQPDQQSAPSGHRDEDVRQHALVEIASSRRN